MSNFMTAIEKVVYKACPDNPDHTVAVKQAWVESNFYGLRSAIKSFGIERFKVNCEKATDGFNFVLEKLQQQRNCLREIGHVKMVEFQERKDQLKNQAELLKIAARERSDIIKEKTDNLKETA